MVNNIRLTELATRIENINISKDFCSTGNGICTIAGAIAGLSFAANPTISRGIIVGIYVLSAGTFKLAKYIKNQKPKENKEIITTLVR